MVKEDDLTSIEQFCWNLKKEKEATLQRAQEWSFSGRGNNKYTCSKIRKSLKVSQN